MNFNLDPAPKSNPKKVECLQVLQKPTEAWHMNQQMVWQILVQTASKQQHPGLTDADRVWFMVTNKHI